MRTINQNLFAILYFLLPQLLFGQIKTRNLRIGVNGYNVYTTIKNRPDYIIGFNLHMVNKGGDGPYLSLQHGNFGKESSEQSKVIMVAGGYHWQKISEVNPELSINFGLAAGYYNNHATGVFVLKNTYFPNNPYEVPFDQRLETFFAEAKFGGGIEFIDNLGVELLLIFGFKSNFTNADKWKYINTPMLGIPFNLIYSRPQIMLWYLIPNKKKKQDLQLHSSSH